MNILQMVKDAQMQLRSTTKNWDEQCLFEADAILTKIIENTQPCGHPLFAIVQAKEGTAFCGMCADEARLHGVTTGTGI